MSAVGPRANQTASLEQLIALSQEMAALVRAGIPFEKSLVEIGRELSGRQGAIAEQLGARLAGGETLDQILDDEGSPLPVLWRSVFRAGLRSGDLAGALDGLAKSGRRVTEIRRIMHLATIYPVILLVVSYGVMLLMASHLMPAISATYVDISATIPPLTAFLASTGEWLVGSAIWFTPLGGVVLAVCWYRLTHMPTLHSASTGSTWTRHLWPLVWPLGQILRDGRLAAFVELLAMMVNYRVPLGDALALAGKASGDDALSAAADEARDRLNRGETPDLRDGPFPPMLQWLLFYGHDSQTMSAALGSSADRYRRRAARNAEVAAVSLPLVSAAMLGGCIVLVQVWTIFGPVWRLMIDLGKVI